MARSSISVRVDGLRELDEMMGRELTKAGARSVLRRTLLEAAEPLAAKMRAAAPKGPDMILSESIDVGTKLSGRQASLHKKMRHERPDLFAEAFVGPGPDAAGVQQEFGNMHHGPQSFARPAWDEDQRPLLDRIKVALWEQVATAAARARRKVARAGR